MTVVVLWLFVTESWVGLWCESVVFTDHTHLFFMQYVLAVMSTHCHINYDTDAYFSSKIHYSLENPC